MNVGFSQAWERVENIPSSAEPAGVVFGTQTTTARYKALLFDEIGNHCLLLLSQSLCVHNSTAPMTADIVLPDAYQRITQISQLFKQALSSVRSPSTRPPSESIPTTPHYVLALKIPDNVQAELDDGTVLLELRSALSQAIVNLQDEYRRVFEKAYKDSLVNLPGHIPGAQMFGAMLERRFATQALPPLMEQHLKTKEEIARSLQAASTISSTSSKPFNNV